MEAILPIAVDDFLLSGWDETTQQQFYNHLSSAFDITTPPDITKLKFLSLQYINRIRNKYRTDEQMSR